MTWHLAYALIVSAYCLRLLKINDRLRKTSPADRAWRLFEKRAVGR